MWPQKDLYRHLHQYLLKQRYHYLLSRLQQQQNYYHHHYFINSTNTIKTASAAIMLQLQCENQISQMNKEVIKWLELHKKSHLKTKTSSTRVPLTSFLYSVYPSWVTKIFIQITPRKLVIPRKPYINYFLR